MAGLCMTESHYAASATTAQWQEDVTVPCLRHIDRQPIHFSTDSHTYLAS